MRYGLCTLLTFSIRDLLWLTVVVAVCSVWCIEHNTASDFKAKLAKKQFDIRRLIGYHQPFA